MNTRSKARLSILKRPTPEIIESSPTKTLTKLTRRISFSGKKTVKEFATDEDKMTIWGTSYEESAEPLQAANVHFDGTTKNKQILNNSLQNKKSGSDSRPSQVQNANMSRHKKSMDVLLKEVDMSIDEDITETVTEVEKKELLETKRNITRNTLILNSNIKVLENTYEKREIEGIQTVISPKANSSTIKVKENAEGLHSKQKLFQGDSIHNQSNKSIKIFNFLMSSESTIGNQSSVTPSNTSSIKNIGVNTSSIEYCNLSINAKNKEKNTMSSESYIKKRGKVCTDIEKQYLKYKNENNDFFSAHSKHMSEQLESYPPFKSEKNVLDRINNIQYHTKEKKNIDIGEKLNSMEISLLQSTLGKPHKANRETIYFDKENLNVTTVNDHNFICNELSVDDRIEFNKNYENENELTMNIYSDEVAAKKQVKNFPEINVCNKDKDNFNLLLQSQENVMEVLSAHNSETQKLYFDSEKENLYMSASSDNNSMEISTVQNNFDNRPMHRKTIYYECNKENIEIATQYENEQLAMGMSAKDLKQEKIEKTKYYPDNLKSEYIPMEISLAKKISQSKPVHRGTIYLENDNEYLNITNKNSQFRIDLPEYYLEDNEMEMSAVNPSYRYQSKLMHRGTMYFEPDRENLNLTVPSEANVRTSSIGSASIGLHKQNQRPYETINCENNKENLNIPQQEYMAMEISTVCSTPSSEYFNPRRATICFEDDQVNMNSTHHKEIYRRKSDQSKYVEIERNSKSRSTLLAMDMSLKEQCQPIEKRRGTIYCEDDLNFTTQPESNAMNISEKGVILAHQQLCRRAIASENEEENTNLNTSRISDEMEISKVERIEQNKSKTKPRDTIYYDQNFQSIPTERSTNEYIQQYRSELETMNYDYSMRDLKLSSQTHHHIRSMEVSPEEQSVKIRRTRGTVFFEGDNENFFDNTKTRSSEQDKILLSTDRNDIINISSSNYMSKGKSISPHVSPVLSQTLNASNNRQTIYYEKEDLELTKGLSVPAVDELQNHSSESTMNFYQLPVLEQIDMESTERSLLPERNRETLFLKNMSIETKSFSTKTESLDLKRLRNCSDLDNSDTGLQKSRRFNQSNNSSNDDFENEIESDCNKKSIFPFNVDNEDYQNYLDKKKTDFQKERNSFMLNETHINKQEFTLLKGSTINDTIALLNLEIGDVDKIQKNTINTIPQTPDHISISNNYYSNEPQHNILSETTKANEDLFKTKINRRTFLIEPGASIFEQLNKQQPTTIGKKSNIPLPIGNSHSKENLKKEILFNQNEISKNLKDDSTMDVCRNNSFEMNLSISSLRPNTLVDNGKYITSSINLTPSINDNINNISINLVDSSDHSSSCEMLQTPLKQSDINRLNSRKLCEENKSKIISSACNRVNIERKKKSSKIVLDFSGYEQCKDLPNIKKIVLKHISKKETTENSSWGKLLFDYLDSSPINQKETIVEEVIKPYLPTVKSSEFLIRNLVENEHKQWLYFDLLYNIGIMKFKHKKIKTFELIVKFETEFSGKSNQTREKLLFKDITIEDCQLMLRNLSNADRKMHLEFKNKVPYCLNSMFKCSTELSYMLSFLNKLCEETFAQRMKTRNH